MPNLATSAPNPTPTPSSVTSCPIPSQSDLVPPHSAGGRTEVLVVFLSKTLVKCNLFRVQHLLPKHQETSGSVLTQQGDAGKAVEAARDWWLDWWFGWLQVANGVCMVATQWRTTPPPFMSLARAIIPTSEWGGGAREAILFRSSWGGQRHAPGVMGGGGGLQCHLIFDGHFVYAFSGLVHFLEASFGCMLCTSYIFLTHLELTLAWLTFFVLFDISGLSPACTSQAPLLANVLPLGVLCPGIASPVTPTCHQRFPFLLCTQEHTRANKKQN